MKKARKRQIGLLNWVYILSLFLWVHFGRSQRYDDTRTSNEYFESVVYCRQYYQCTTPFESYPEASSVCSCHPACNLFHDCCYDTTEYNAHVNRTNITSSSLLHSISDYKDFFQCTTDIIANEMYWMVSKCPPSWPAESQECVSTSDGQRTVGNLQDLSSIPVVSTDGITFRNIYCALCHGLATDTLIPWSLQAECSERDPFPSGSKLNLTEKISRLIDICETVAFRPPVNHPFHLSTVIPCRKPAQELIQICNATGVGEDTKSNCAAINAPIHVLGYFFKNQDCAECYFASRNGFNVSYVDICIFEPLPPTGGRVDDSYTSESICDEMTPALVPISITFNFGGQSGDVTVTSAGYEIEKTTVECTTGQVFDPTSSKCAPLMCPTGYDLVETECVKDGITQQNVTSCDSVLFDVTINANQGPSNHCLVATENLEKCTPGSLSLLKTIPQWGRYSCTSNSDITEFAFEANISQSVEIIEKLFTQTKLQEPSTTFNPNQCDLINSIGISAVCSSSKDFLNCDLVLLHNSSWFFLENSTTQIMIENSSTILNISEVRFHRRLQYSDEGNLVESVSIQRCTPCPLVTLRASLFQPEKIGSDTLVYTKNQSMRFSPGMYELDSHGNVTVCNFLVSSGEILRFFPKYSTAQSILSTVGIILSIIALSFSLITYSVFPTLRTRIASILIMTLCACLIIAQVCLILAGIVVSSSFFCALVSGIGHFFWLTTFAASSVLGFSLDQTFSLRNQTILGHKPSSKSIAVYLISCLTIPSIICGTLMILYLVDGEGLGITYGDPSGCWIGSPRVNLFAFGVPVAVALVINLAFFAHVVVSLCIQHRHSSRIRKTGQESHIRELLIYIKIFLILGLTWITGFVASAANVDVLWFPFIILTSLQGVFIFLAFTVKSQIWDLWRKKIVSTYTYSSRSDKNGFSQSTETSAL